MTTAPGRPTRPPESVWDYPRPPRVEAERPTRAHRRQDGVTVADSTRALRRVLERSHPPTWYLPAGATYARRCLRAARAPCSFCEWKGEGRSIREHRGVGVGLLRRGRRGATASRGRQYKADEESPRVLRVTRVDACYVDEELVVAQPGGFYGGWITRDGDRPVQGQPGLVGLVSAGAARCTPTGLPCRSRAAGAHRTPCARACCGAHAHTGGGSRAPAGTRRGRIHRWTPTRPWRSGRPSRTRARRPTCRPGSGRASPTRWSCATRSPSGCRSTPTGHAATYAYALGLPVAWVDHGGVARRGEAAPPAARAPRPAAPPRLVRWCAARDLDPRAATAPMSRDGCTRSTPRAQPRTRRRMFSTLSALYAHLTETGVIPANPAALNRSRLGLAARAGRFADDPATAAQVAALLPRRPPGPPSAAGTAAVRHPLGGVRRPAHPRPAGLGDHRTRPRRPLPHRRRRRAARPGQRRPAPRGLRHRRRPEALAAYLAERDPLAGTANPARRGRAGAVAAPSATRAGGRCSRIDLYTQLRRIAADAGPALDGVADRVHPHALRHAYVTIALEHDAPIHHVRADVGHATIATTQHYDRGLRRRSASAADVVAAAIAESLSTDQQVSRSEP